jgi:zinc protease
MAYYTLVRVGSRNEVEKGKSGFAHFFEHMMFRGTRQTPPEARDSFMKRIGADDNAYTTDDFTCYQVFGASSQMDELVRIEADRFKNLDYTKTQFKTEAGAVLGEYNKNFSNPAEAMDEKLSAAAFTQHTYRHTTIGFKEDIEAMPKQYDYSKLFFKRWYTPDNSTIVVAGDVNASEISALVRKYYADWTTKTAEVKILPEPAQNKERRVDMKWDTETNPRFMMAWHTPAQDLAKKDFAVQSVLGSMLMGEASELHKQLVIDQGIVEDLDNWTFDHRDPHLFRVLVTLKEEKDRDAARTALEKAIASFAAGNVDEKLLADVKSRAKYSVLTSLETPEDVANAITWSAGANGDPKAIEKELQMLDSVTAGDVAAFAKQYLVDSNRTTVHLTSKEGS